MVSERGGRAGITVTGVALALTLFSAAFWFACRSSPPLVADRDWPYYAGDLASTKFSPLGQIKASNVSQLQVVWRWDSPDNAILQRYPSIVPFIYEATPLMRDGVLYTSTSLSQAAAIDAGSGETRWVFDPEVYREPSSSTGYTHRGVAFWESGGKRRVFLATSQAFLYSLDAETGHPDPEFAEEGRLDLLASLDRPVRRSDYAVTSPPLVMGDRVIVGSSISDLNLEDPAPGDVRAFDAATGRLLWTFHTIPRGEEFGTESWEADSWLKAGHANVWSPMSADVERGLLYLPVSTPNNDYYGVARPGNGLFGESLVCLRAETGERVWHFQMTHHGLWDYDLPAAPILVDLPTARGVVPAVVQLTKQGFAFVFNRLNGEPIWPLEERPAPQQGAMPGERLSPTQPVPTRPPAFDRQGLSEDDLIDFTPELRQEASKILSHYQHGPLYTPPSARGTVNSPGNSGGAYWAGGAFDPATRRLFVPSITTPFVLTLKEYETSQGKKSWALDPGADLILRGPRGLPITKPPYSRITALDLESGEIAWSVAMGEGPRNHPALASLDLPRLGSGGRHYVLATGSLLFAGEGISALQIFDRLRGLPFSDCCQNRPLLSALDKESGELIYSRVLPHFPSGAPMTYALEGRQYLVLPLGGLHEPAELIALSLP